MTEKTRTSDYLNQLENKGYERCSELRHLYDTWKKSLDIKPLQQFLDITWQDRDRIRADFSHGNIYNHFRRTVFEKFCYDLLRNIIKKTGSDHAAELFWNERIKVKSTYLFERGSFKKHPKYIPVDIAIGVHDGDQIHPRVIVNCNIWQTFSQLGNDQANFDIIYNKYPMLTGYNLTLSMSMDMDPMRLSTSYQQIGVKVCNISEENELDEFVEDIKGTLVSEG